MKAETDADLHAFFQDMMLLSAPRATRIVQDETGNRLRDQDVEVKELPTHFTKRGMFCRYGLDRGHEIELKDHNSPRAHDDEQDIPLWPTGSATKDIVSWKTFRNFWGKYYSKLILPNARHDICGECFILANSFRSKKCCSARRADATDDDDDNDDNDDAVGPCCSKMVA
jgi:hypothetical protein